MQPTYDFLVIDTTGLKRPDHIAILRGHFPQARILARLHTTTQKACTVAKLHLDTASGSNGLPIHDLMLLDPNHPENQDTTKFYSVDMRGTAYKYRVHCGLLDRCENEDGIFTVHYCSPSKRGDREGMALCRKCRWRVGPSQRARQALSDRNHARAGVPRQRVKKEKATETVDTARPLR